jgi:hypothetical protein
MLFFHSYKSPGLVVDVVGDIRAINDSAMRASPRRTGMIILGGGEPGLSSTRTTGRCLRHVAQAQHSTPHSKASGTLTALKGPLRSQASSSLGLLPAECSIEGFGTHVTDRMLCMHCACDVSAGVPKHHINNANLMRNGADFAVMLNTAQEFDGSDSGARPDEAISWGKIKPDAQPVKVCGDATILFPLLVSQTFYKHWDRRTKEQAAAAAAGGSSQPQGQQQQPEVHGTS